MDGSVSKMLATGQASRDSIPGKGRVRFLAAMPGPSPRPAGYEALEARSRMLGVNLYASCVPAGCCAGAQ